MMWFGRFHNTAERYNAYTNSLLTHPNLIGAKPLRKSSFGD